MSNIRIQGSRYLLGTFSEKDDVNQSTKKFGIANYKLPKNPILLFIAKIFRNYVVYFEGNQAYYFNRRSFEKWSHRHGEHCNLKAVNQVINKILLREGKLNTYDLYGGNFYDQHIALKNKLSQLSKEDINKFIFHLGDECIDIESTIKIIIDLRKCLPEGVHDKNLTKAEWKILNRDLFYWIFKANNSVRKGRCKADILIKKAFESKSTKLNLENLDLHELPKSLGFLTHLKKLNVRGNSIKKWPLELCNLIQLRTLNACGNKLKELPSEICQLTHLQKLYLINNELASLPIEIGQLSQLKWLFLKSNNLSSLPSEFGQLHQLKVLELDNNDLKILPAELGRLAQLWRLNLKENLFLQELPISIGSITGLMEIHTEGTNVPLELVNAILERCRALRNNEMNRTLPLRLNLWKTLAQSEHELVNLVEVFNQEEKEDVNEWLNRLERTKDFSSQTPLQSKLAKVACDILALACQNPSFRESFLTQIKLNNEDCMDRAAMSFNELYTSYRITMMENETIPVKLEILERAAKTAALHEAIARKIDQEEKSTGNLVLENVEIYLFYETKLKNELNLLSAIETMTYSEIGKRTWIEESELKNEVEKTYRNHLIQMDVFKKLIADHPSYKVNSERIDEKFQQKTEDLILKLDLAEKKLKALAKRTEVSEKDIAEANHAVLTLKAELGEINLQRDQELAQLAISVFNELKAI